MWVDHGAFPPGGGVVPMSELRFKSGLPCRLFVVEGNAGPQEGAGVAVVAGGDADLAEHPDGPLVRMHSACIFSEMGDNPQFDAWLLKGDVLDPSDRFFQYPANPSNECDCRAQRKAAQALIAWEGGVYCSLIEQEGRGWGLGVKRKIYELQKQGYNTAQACDMLGLEFDVRRYDHMAKFLLRDLGLTAVRLLSNNPRKMRALEEWGVRVTTVPHLVGVTSDNIEYLKTKRDKGGHMLPGNAELETLLDLN